MRQWWTLPNEPAGVWIGVFVRFTEGYLQNALGIQQVQLLNSAGMEG